jgi:hypothetical protein
MKTIFYSDLTKRAEGSAASTSCFDSTFEVIGIFSRATLLNYLVSSQPSFEKL